MKPIVALTPEELRALLTKARERDQRAYLLFLVAVLHGLRVSEVINLRTRDFSCRLWHDDSDREAVERLQRNNPAAALIG